MSASPSGGPLNGHTPSPNLEGRPQFIRRPRPADPLRQSKRPQARAPPVPKSTTAKSFPLNTGAQTLSNGARPNLPHAPNGISPARPTASFTSTPTGLYQDFPLVTTKRALREGLRYHVARFPGRKDIDPANQDEFVRPVSLHRRDPRQPPPGKVMKDEDIVMGDIMDDKEREKQEIAKAERDAQRAADLAQIAPTGNAAAAAASKKNNFFRNEKTTQIFKIDEDDKAKKESDLRYEESLPWHLEDAENKHTFFGTYEASLSKTNVIMFVDEGNFKMVPVEKWYKFTAKNLFKTLTIEEAETEMSKKSRASRWVMHSDQLKTEDKEKEASRRQMGNLYLVKGESATFKNSGKSEIQDVDDLDFDGDGDLFADDDEQPAFEKDQDEETKFAEEKIKRDQRAANLFGEGDVAEVDKEFEEDEKQKDLNKKQEKGTKKALKKRERNYLYDSDSSHPYSTSSEDDTSDEEKQKEEDRKKDEEAKLKAKITSKLPSGASSKGTNTPLQRPKQSDLSKRHNHLKRSGSPNLSASETSGNESSRKKYKKKHVMSSSQPTGTSTPIPTSGGMSSTSASQPVPGLISRKSSIIKLNVNSTKLSEIQSAAPNPSSAMSDGEGTAGEMSDGAKGSKKKIKLRLGASPSASRAGSPSIGSRAGSPGAPVVVPAQPQQSNAIAPPPPPPPPSDEVKAVTAEEIAAALPPEGIAIALLLKLFAGRIQDKQKFISMVKNNSSYNPADKLLRPKV